MAGANGGWPAPPTLQVASNLLRSISPTASTIRWMMSSCGSHSIMSTGSRKRCRRSGGRKKGAINPHLGSMAPRESRPPPQRHTSSCQGGTNLPSDTATGSQEAFHVAAVERVLGHLLTLAGRQRGDHPARTGQLQRDEDRRQGDVNGGLSNTGCGCRHCCLPNAGGWQYCANHPRHSPPIGSVEGVACGCPLQRSERSKC